ncbi:3-methyl-2-oxobutanoate hydroxymethyltransferase [Kribbella sp. NPDC050820]|uniref:3-methyl-2-oxobutanoate hydroxymethyltransferase n=1 Tax=Kribbella sp. NPDC050820 TaxID=3155408 RepID=UPI0033D5D424
MVDNFLSAGTQDDDELPSPYGTGPKNRTTEEHRRSDYGDEAWRDRGNGLGLDPSPSLPNAPRAYERGPVPQQPYVPKPPYLPGPPPPPAGQPQQQRGYGEQPRPQQPPYGEQPQGRPYGEQQYYDTGRGEPSRGDAGRGDVGRGDVGRGEPSRGEAGRGEALRGEALPGEPGRGEALRGEPGRGEALRGEAGRGEALRGEPGRGEPSRGDVGRGEPGRGEESPFGPASYQEQSPFRRQQPQQNPVGPPPQQGRPSPFGPGSNGVPPNRQAPGAPQQLPQRPPAPPQAGSNGVTPHPPAPHSSNGTANGIWSGPAPTPAQNGGPHNNGVTQQQPPSQAPTPPPAPAQPQSQQQQAPAQGPAPTPAPANPQQGNNSLDAPTITAYLPEMVEAARQSDNGYPSDPSAEYESNTPMSEEPKRVGARRRADVQQDAPSQVANEHTGSHRARRAQAAAGNAPAAAQNPAEAAGAPQTPAGPSGSAPSSGSVSSSGSVPSSGSVSSSGSAPLSGAGPLTGAAPGSGPAPGSAEGSGQSKRPRRYRVHHLRDMKNRGEKWAMLTAYDQYTAEIFDHAGIPVLLVGDSAANNVFGYETTLRVTVDELIPLARAVAGAVDRALVVADLPFGSYQASPEQAFHTAVRFMKEAGVHAVKLEGGRTVVPMVEKLTQSGIPVMAHIGFTPQSEHSIGGYRVQGRGDQAAGLIDDAIALAEAGAFSVVLEMVPGDVAAEITKRVTIPTIGIGAGRDTDAQVLVWQDMAGMRSGTMPRFVKQYADLRGILTTAATTYAAEVASGTFPTDEHTF